MTALWLWWVIFALASFLILEFIALYRGDLTLTALVRQLHRRYWWFAIVVCSACAAILAHWFWQ